jgi:cysteine desulfurase/selenocysteine lyase
MKTLGYEHIAQHGHELLEYATERVKEIQGLRIIGTSKHKVSVLSFVLEDAHPHDVGSILDSAGIVVRAGHHCAQPVMKFFGIPATTRASFACFNDKTDVDALIQGLRTVKEIFG